MANSPKHNSSETAAPPAQRPDDAKPVYTQEDLAETGFDAERDLGYPGQFPFTRGIHPTMYRGRLWTMRQYAGMGDAEEANERFRYLLAHGTAGLSVAFDLPTQIGYDSDDPTRHRRSRQGGSRHRFARRHGAAVRRHSARPQVSTSMTINATAAILLALYVAAARRSRTRSAQAFRHRTERHSQGIHCARNLHLSRPPGHAPCDRHLRVGCRTTCPS